MNKQYIASRRCILSDKEVKYYYNRFKELCNKLKLTNILISKRLGITEGRLQSIINRMRKEKK